MVIYFFRNSNLFFFRDLFFVVDLKSLLANTSSQRIDTVCNLIAWTFFYLELFFGLTLDSNAIIS